MFTLALYVQGKRDGRCRYWPHPEKRIFVAVRIFITIEAPNCDCTQVVCVKAFQFAECMTIQIETLLLGTLERYGSFNSPVCMFSLGILHVAFSFDSEIHTRLEDHITTTTVDLRPVTCKGVM